ncbi:MAG: cytochrome P450 [Pseudomonadota bacterium]
MTTLFIPPVPPVQSKEAQPVSGPIGLVKALASFTRNPLESVTEDLLTKPVVEQKMFGATHLFVNDPAMIRHICKTNLDNYPLGYWRELMFKRMMPNGIISLNGDRWKSARKLMNPVFSPRALEGFATLMKYTCDRHVERLVEQEGQTVAMSTVFQELALDILLDSLIASEDMLDRAQLVKDSDDLAQAAGHLDVADALRMPDWVPRFRLRKQQALTARIAGAVRQVIDRRRAEGSEGGAEKHDFLSLLMATEDEREARFSDEEIVDNLLTIIGAGHETTARSLGWTAYLLSQTPDIMARLEEEIDAAPLDELPPHKWLSALPFAEAVIKESLRLFPPAPELSRTALEDDHIGDLTIKAGTEVHVTSWLIHRNRNLWENPDAFDPDRFLGERGKSIDRYQFLPFSTGPRVCIGGAFAMTEMVIALATLVRRVRLSYQAPDLPIPVVRITVRPSNDLPMKVALREEPRAPSLSEDIDLESVAA